MPRLDDDDDIENHPVVVELRRALEIQGSVIGQIHSDGDAHTRRQDHGPLLRRSVDFFLPLLLGMIVGALGTYATVTGRIATVEAIVAAHGVALTTTERRWEKLGEQMDEVNRKLEGISEQLKTRTRDR